jgi:hypothetical protein
MGWKRKTTEMIGIDSLRRCTSRCGSGRGVRDLRVAAHALTLSVGVEWLKAGMSMSGVCRRWFGGRARAPRCRAERQGMRLVLVDGGRRSGMGARRYTSASERKIRVRVGGAA